MFPLEPTYTSYSYHIFLRHCVCVPKKSHSEYKVHGCEQGQELCPSALTGRSRSQLGSISGTFEASLHFVLEVGLKPLWDQNRDVTGIPLEPKVACPELPDQRARAAAWGVRSRDTPGSVSRCRSSRQWRFWLASSRHAGL